MTATPATPATAPRPAASSRRPFLRVAIPAPSVLGIRCRALVLVVVGSLLGQVLGHRLLVVGRALGGVVLPASGGPVRGVVGGRPLLGGGGVPAGGRPCV